VYLLDVNVVVAAHRDDHPRHRAIREWFDSLTAGDDPFTVPVQVWASFLRIVTNRRVFPVPTPREAAFAFIDATCGQPNYLPTTPGPRHMTLLRVQCDEADAQGDLVQDAVLAALAAEHRCTVATLDRDFARFPSVRHELLL
jgi:toxin-antitoxin system PIN domain toxin